MARIFLGAIASSSGTKTSYGISGIAFPRSQFETARSLIPSISANWAWVRPFSFRQDDMNDPILD